MQAKAVVFPSPIPVEVCPVECPDPTAGDRLIPRHPFLNGDGTERSCLRGERIAGDTAYREGDPSPFPIWGRATKKIGVVEWVGDDVDEH